MAKQIPRLDAGSAAAAVPTSRPGSDEAAGIVASFGKIADTGYAVAADAEKTLAARQQAAMEAKQAVVNEVDAGRRAGDYEESLVGYMEGLKTEYADAPDKAPGELLTIGRQLQDRMQEQAPNSAVGLAVAQRANARLDSAMKEMHAWVLLRQTQKAKGDLQVTINRATAAAEGQGSVATLGAFIKSKEAELTPIFQKVLGGAESVTAMKTMREDMARSWVLAVGDKNPVGVLQALDDKTPGNPLVDYLDVSHREALKKETLSSFEGMTKTRELETIKKGLTDNKQLFESFSAGDPDLGMAFESQRKALESEKSAVLAKFSVDSTALKKLGIDVQGQTPGDIVKVIDSRLAFVTALNHARKRQLPFDAEDDPSTVEGLMLAADKALKPKNGKDLSAVVEQQTRLAVAMNDKKVSASTAQTLFKTLALSLETASGRASDVGGRWLPDFVNTWRIWKDPLDAGNVELNRQFKGTFNGLPPAAKVRARLLYTQDFVSAHEQDQKLSALATREMALRALAIVEAEEAEKKGGASTQLPGVK